MLAEGWIYGNARVSEEKADGFFVRFCSPGLREYKEELLNLSKQLLEGMSRDSEEECWMTGYLDEGKQIYVIAAAGNQEHLLHMKLSCRENRGFFCVMAYCLPREGIALYERDSEMFEVLKEKMRRINQKMADKTEKKTEKMELCLEQYRMKEELGDFRRWSIETAKNPLNLLKSTEERDEMVWKAGLQRLVVTGMESELAARRILEKFPRAIVTVRGNVVKEMYYQAPQRQEMAEKHTVGKLLTEKQITGKQIAGKQIVGKQIVGKQDIEKRQQKSCSQYQKTVKRCGEEIAPAEVKRILKFENQEFRYFCYLYCWMYEYEEGKERAHRQQKTQSGRNRERQMEVQQKTQKKMQKEMQSGNQAWILLGDVLKNVTGKTYSFREKKQSSWNNWNQIQKEWVKWVDNTRETAQEINRQLAHVIEKSRAEGRA